MTTSKTSWYDSAAGEPRGVSLLPRVHLAILGPEMLRADMHQVFAEANDSHDLVFITAPATLRIKS